MDKFVKLLKGNGLKATPQRLEILKVIEKLGHPSIEDIYHHLGKNFPSISLATVYKNLNLLRDIGIVHQLHIRKGHRYELRTTSHAHLVCSQCGKIQDLELKLELCEQLKEKYPSATFDLYIYDLCSACNSNR